MTAQQLKSSILQMAVQGKLVPQDPNDESASVLLNRIQTEKEQMVKEGKIKKEKNPSVIFRGDDNLPYEKIGDNEPVCIADEVPFEIPDSWEWVRISCISSVITKGTTPRGGNVSYVEEGIGFLRAENISGLDKLEKTNLKYVEAKTHFGYLKRSILSTNDILITIAGTLGRTAIVKESDLPLNANQAVSIIRLVNSREFDLLYIVCALNSPDIQKALTQQKKITAIPNLTLEIISNCLIPIPPREEQHRISENISKCIPLLDNYKTEEVKLDYLVENFPDQLKKSVLQQAVQGKLVPQDPGDEPASVLLERIRAEKEQMIKDGKIKRDKHESVIYRRDDSFYEKIDGIEQCIDDEIPFEIPKSWEWVRLGSILTVSSGDGLTSREMNTFGKYPVYGGNGVAGFHSEYNVDHPTLVIGRVGYYCGSTHIAPGKSWVTDNAFIATFDEININMLWLKLFIDYTEPRKKASSTAQPVISGKLIYPLLMPLPPKSEQDRIVKKTEKTNIIIGNLQSDNKAI